jgi:hypothetical protein
MTLGVVPNIVAFFCLLANGVLLFMQARALRRWSRLNAALFGIAVNAIRYPHMGVRVMGERYDFKFRNEQ